MPDRKIMLPPGGGVVRDLTVRLKLIVRLMTDRRVSPLLKLLPIGSLVYFLVPDLAVGPIDDAAIIGLAAYLFVELCPPDVVQEHLEEIVKTRRVIDRYGGGSARNSKPTGQQETAPEGEIIDGEVISSDKRDQA